MSPQPPNSLRNQGGAQCAPPRTLETAEGPALNRVKCLKMYMKSIFSKMYPTCVSSIFASLFGFHSAHCLRSQQSLQIASTTAMQLRETHTIQAPHAIVNNFHMVVKSLMVMMMMMMMTMITMIIMMIMMTSTVIKQMIGSLASIHSTAEQPPCLTTALSMSSSSSSPSSSSTLA